MKLTERGADYHLAVLALVGVGVVSGWGVFSALALGLTFSSLASLTLARARTRTVEARVHTRRLRLIKQEEGTLIITIPALRDRWARVEVESVRVRGPVDASIAKLGREDLELRVRPNLAGRFEEVGLYLRVVDALGLFYAGHELSLEGLVIDSLPKSLVTPVRRAFVPPLVVGESPAGSAGRGQEFFGIETYTQHSESKDILWSRAAKEPNKPLLARVREANNPDSVLIRVLRGSVRPESMASETDLECEALGTLGRALILAGVGIRMVAHDGSALMADTEEELADSIMRMSVLGASPPATHPPAGEADVLVVVGNVGLATMLDFPRRPSVFIGGAPAADRYSVSFTGAEDLSKVVNLVLSK